MKLKFWVNNSAPYVAYKNKTNAKEIDSAKLKDPSDVLSPVLMINKTALGDGWANYNYVEIPMFNRKYFASFVADRGGILEFKCHVDVLSTYAGKIVGSTFEIERAYSSGKAESLLYADTERPLQINKRIERDPAQRLLILPQSTGGGYFLTVAGGAPSTP